jgi:hypothetical protein
MRPSLCGTENIDGLSRVLAQKHAETTPLGKLSDIIGGTSPLIRCIPESAPQLNPLREGAVGALSVVADKAENAASRGMASKSDETWKRYLGTTTRATCGSDMPFDREDQLIAIDETSHFRSLPTDFRKSGQ